MNICIFFNDTATTEIYTLSLHDALPISENHALDVALARKLGNALRRSIQILRGNGFQRMGQHPELIRYRDTDPRVTKRSEEHTSELQSRQYLVCRLLLEKKKNLFTLIVL